MAAKLEHVKRTVQCPQAGGESSQAGFMLGEAIKGNRWLHSRCSSHALHPSALLLDAQVTSDFQIQPTCDLKSQRCEIAGISVVMSELIFGCDFAECPAISNRGDFLAISNFLDCDFGIWSSKALLHGAQNNPRDTTGASHHLQNAYRLISDCLNAFGALTGKFCKSSRGFYRTGLLPEEGSL